MRLLAVVALTVGVSLGCAGNADVMQEGEAKPAAQSAPGLGGRGAGYGGGGVALDATTEGVFGGEVANAEEDREEAAAPPETARRAKPRPRPAPPKDGKKKGEGDGDEAPEAEVATRSWFPESMLWEPLVVTDDDGVAMVPVRVPDQLTTWRVLALAHDRNGHQSGAEHRFDGTLPVYVEPVMPGWLYAGDGLVLPVQAVNTTSKPLEGRIEVTASGAMSGTGVATVALGPGGSVVRTLPLSVVGAGSATVNATLYAGRDSDGAERVVTVRPTGRPVVGQAGGTLSSSRTLTVKGPKGADPSTEQLEVLVFPGPLAVMQAEVERVAGGAGVVDGAYGFGVATHLRTLSATAGVEVDEGVLRELQIVAWQRIVRSARAPSTGQAADLLLSLREVQGHELAEGLRDRLVQTVVSGQRADGTYSRDATSTAQRVVVETAMAAMSLPATEPGARLRAKGAIERLLPQIDDAYTASVVLASGIAGDSVSAQLRELVEEALVEVDGVSTLPVPKEAKNAWGVRPSVAEVRAFGALALDGHDARGDLVAALMQGWSSRYGFGAAGADPVALKAIAEALPGTPDTVTVTLTVDGQVRSTTTLDPTQPKVPGLLTALPRGGKGKVELRAEPEVPGLAFVATRRSWVPWSAADKVPGVDVEVELSNLAVGRKGQLTLRIAAPKGTRLTLEQGLPAGASVDEPALAGGFGGQLTKTKVQTDRIELTTRAFNAGEIMEFVVPVTAAFGGQFSTGPLMVGVDGRTPRPMKPVRWVVGKGDS